MLDLILIILLVAGILIGLNRGFILQLFHMIGFITAFVVAAMYYDVLAEEMKLWIPYQELSNNAMWPDFLTVLPLEAAFYTVVSFALIFFVVKIILQIIATMLDFVAAIPLMKPLNSIAGAILGFLEFYLIIFVALFVLALTPVEGIQSMINNSSLGLFMLENTPYFSAKLFELVESFVTEGSA